MRCNWCHHLQLAVLTVCVHVFLLPGRLAGCGAHAGAVADHLARALSMQAVSVGDAIAQLGKNCHMPNACQTPLHIVLHAEWQLRQRGCSDERALPPLGRQQVYMAGIKGALAGGGCCASRAAFAGACLGAWLGPEAVPEAWALRCSSIQAVRAHADAICSARGAS